MKNNFLKREVKNVQDNQIVLFQIDDQEYGVNIDTVEGINHYKDFKIIKIPNTEGYVEGIINLRGDVIPLYNLRKKFQLANSEVDIDSEILVVSSSDIKIGFIVDTVVDIIRLSSEDIQSASQLFTQINNEYIQDIGKYEGRMIILLNTQKILTIQEREIIEPLVEVEA